MSTVAINPNEFQGYSVDLLRGLKGLGPKIIDNAELYAAVQAYAATEVGKSGMTMGPALLTADATMVVRNPSAHQPPADVLAPPRVPDATTAATWDTYELDDLIALAAKHSVTLPRVKSPGKVIALLEAAGVTP